MLKIRILIIVIVSLTFYNCITEESKFPIEKRYWDTNDYANVIRELKYGIEPDEKLPTLDDPETRIIVEKLIDRQNYNVVLEDAELGLKHRNRAAEKFFSKWQDMSSIYRGTDRKDNYLYDIEMLEVFQFGLDLQLKYFKLGNDEIIESADDPESYGVKSNVNSNVRTLIKNFSFYLDEINNEKAFSEKGKELFSKGIDKYFVKLIQIYPKANYSGMEKKIDLMLNKSEFEKTKTSLKKIKGLIESKKIKE